MLAIPPLSARYRSVQRQGTRTLLRNPPPARIRLFNHHGECIESSGSLRTAVKCIRFLAFATIIVLCVLHEQTFRLTRLTRDKLLSQVHSLATQPANVRCRVPISLIPPLFGAWPRGSVEMPFQRLSHQPLRMYHWGPQTYIDCFREVYTCQAEIAEVCELQCSPGQTGI